MLTSDSGPLGGERYNEGITEIVEMPDRGHALTIDSRVLPHLAR